MSCNFPLKGFWTGGYTESGANELIISKQPNDLLSLQDVAKMGYTVHPGAPLVEIGGQAFLSDPVRIPCGHCFGCKMDIAKTWTTRLVLEMQGHKYNYFVTLTYDDEHCPDRVSKVEFQKFMKRFRKRYGHSSVRFFACGEYGSETKRPHYHAILMLDYPLDLSAIGVNVFHSAEIADTWKLGLHSVSFAEPACAAYVAGYVVKKQRNPDADLQPFILMSRRPGLGREYFDSHDLLSTLKVYGNFGSKSSSAPLPRYFKTLLGDEYKALASLNKLAAIRQDDLNSSIAGTASPDAKGFYFDDLIKASLEAERKKL